MIVNETGVYVGDDICKEASVWSVGLNARYVYNSYLREGVIMIMKLSNEAILFIHHITHH